MRLAVLALLLLTMASVVWATPEAASEAYKDGNRLYENGDYRASIEAYQKVLELEWTAPELEYNLGNAYLKNGQLGFAVLHYRRALKLNPRYGNAQANLEHARSLTQDVVSEDGTNRMEWLSTLRLGLQATAVLSVLFFLSMIALAILRLRPLREKFWALVLQNMCGVVALLFLAGFIFEWSQAHDDSEGVLTVEETTVRTGPGDTHTISFKLHEGTEMELLREASGWVEIKISDGLQGWVPQDTVERI